MSTRATVLSGSAGTSRRPGASRPAIRRTGSRDSSSGRTPWSINRANVGGSRSEASGSRIRETGVIVAVSDSKTQRTIIGPCRNRSVSPVLRTRSIRQCSAVRHQTRSSLSSPRSWARPTKESLSGNWSPPEVSASPDQAMSPEAWMRPASSVADTSLSAAGRWRTPNGTAISTAAVTSTITQRAVMLASVGAPPQPPGSPAVSNAASVLRAARRLLPECSARIERSVRF